MLGKRIPLLLVSVPILLLVQVDSQRTILDKFIGSFRRVKLLTSRYLDSTINFSELRRQQKLQPEIPDSQVFPCKLARTRSISRPESVHKLRPGDIDIVGAIGDSLTAANGLLATTLPQVLLENRGLSFSIGGEGTWRKFITIPNLLKEFNPKLIGFSTSFSTISTQRASQFNVAEGGAVSMDMPYMAKVLVTRILKDPRVDVKNDWKLITIKIGPNDFCSLICRKNMENELIKHERHMEQVFRTLRDNLPRTIVNFIIPIDIFNLKLITKKPDRCYLTHSGECPCVYGLLYANSSSKYRRFIRRWQHLDIEIAGRKEFQREDFTVVPQTLTMDMSVPLNANNEFDLTYLSADCFHFSQKGNAILALNIWNGMLQPVGKKTPITNYHNFTNIKCPNENSPYIYTMGNS